MFGRWLARPDTIARVVASRRVEVTGLRYALLLHVWPGDGFDNFRWDAFHRSWLGGVSDVGDAIGKAEGVLDAYARGERPPGPAFAE